MCNQDPSTSTTELFAKIVSKVSLKTVTILAKSSILDTWLGAECASADGYNIVLKVQTEMSPWQQVKTESF